jgi:hypothetical protein
MSKPIMTMWTIYYNPSDHPGKYVVRGHDIEAGKSVPKPWCKIVDTYDQAKAQVPRGLFRMLPHPKDDPVIVETWL